MFEDYLAELAAKHLTRRLLPLDSGTGPVVRVGGRDVLLFASNDYLGLAVHPDVVAAAVRATQSYGAGSGAARLVSGSMPPHQELEQALARFKRTESAITFGSGYLANIGAIPALIGRGGLILADRLCHASLFDGCRLSGADLRIYQHNDMEHLATLLGRRRKARRTLIVTDGVFSMDGDLAPLPELATLAQAYEADLYVDDAHGTGVMGTDGRGTVEHFGLETRIPLRMGTLGKALGSSGAFIAGPQSSIHYLLHRCRSFIFATAPPPASAAAAVAALHIVEREPERRRRLWKNRERLFTGLLGLGFTLGPTVTPILPVVIGCAETAVRLSDELLADGLFAPAVRPPTVPPETSRIRVTVTSEHTPAHIDQALTAFERAGKRTRVL
ncbi:MAG TPA: 8-amino-7-oxononanoate synthase [Nitrospira sp.]|jgi:8-amino-7-oxononanoate synthase|nr:8-amino-7-oxononanoate synthase [Nitrospira sp.]